MNTLIANENRTFCWSESSVCTSWGLFVVYWKTSYYLTKNPLKDAILFCYTTNFTRNAYQYKWFSFGVCSTDNSLWPIFSPDLESLEHATSRISGGDFRLKNVTSCLYFLFGTVCCFSAENVAFYHFHFFLWWRTKFPQQDIQDISDISDISRYYVQDISNQKRELLIRNGH